MPRGRVEARIQERKDAQKEESGGYEKQEFRVFRERNTTLHGGITANDDQFAWRQGLDANWSGHQHMPMNARDCI